MDDRAAEWGGQRRWFRSSHLARSGRRRAVVGCCVNRRRRPALTVPHAFSLVLEKRDGSPTSSREDDEHDAQQGDTRHEEYPILPAVRHDDSMARCCDGVTHQPIGGDRASGSQTHVAAYCRLGWSLGQHE